MISISIIIPCLNEEKYVASCIESIIHSEIDYKKTEIIFVDGDSSDKTVEIIKSYSKEYPFITLLTNPKKYTPISMNLGINASSGEFIFILSAHAKYERSYFKMLSFSIKSLDAKCVGGILLTEVKNVNTKSSSIKIVLTNKFGVGNASFRLGSRVIKKVDTVAFGCYQRDTFDKFGLFNERLIRNQDIELNKRIINGGGSIYLIPEVKCIYYARENFKDLAKNNYANGLWNILTAYYTKTLKSLSLRHFIPLFFILSLFIPLLFSLFFPKLLWVSLLSLISYLSLVIIISFRLRSNATNLWYLILSFFTLHFSYGIGSLLGFFVIIPKYFKGNK